MPMWQLSVTVLVVLAAVGCVRRHGRNSDCQWPGEPDAHSPDSRHMSADAEFAEDLAIRYADTHYGSRTPAFVSWDVYDAARDQCMQTLFTQIAKEHDVPVGRVSGALGRNRFRVDTAAMLPFALVCCFASTVVARMTWRRYSPIEHGWVPGVLMALFLSLVFAAGCEMAGDLWSSLVENMRIGNGHLSYRGQRLWVTRYRPELFVGSLIVFWLAVAQGAYGMRPVRSLRSGQAR